MKKMKRLTALIFCVFAVFALAACDTSAPVAKTDKTPETGKAIEKETAQQIDRNIPAPVFNGTLRSEIVISADTVYQLDGTAVSPDGGEIRYQWYSNNVNSNSGGTYIEGATEPVYQADTSELGTKFYYVVATNSHGNVCNKATGNVARVEVRKAGAFTADEFGGVRLIADDGSYPADVFMRVGDDEYYFDANGYITSGWVYLNSRGNFYYFDEAGRLAKNAETPDGYHTDDLGGIIEPVNPYE